MRISISNIAWDVHEDSQIFDLLRKYNINAIDIAPGKYFPDPVQANDNEILAVKNKWNKEGFDIVGMQSLLFGTQGLNVFSSAETQNNMFRHLKAVCRVAAGLGVKALVFGSPKNRDRHDLNDQKSMEIAVSFFRSLGDIAKEFGVIICLEPNPTCYGANFMTTSMETSKVVRNVAHSHIKMQLDIGAITINNENIHEVLARDSDIIGHIHLSEPDLKPLGHKNTNHKIIADELARYFENSIATIEMLVTSDTPHLLSIEESLKIATSFYRGNVRGDA